jgi:hypothetical protein
MALTDKDFLNTFPVSLAGNVGLGSSYLQDPLFTGGLARHGYDPMSFMNAYRYTESPIEQVEGPKMDCCTTGRGLYNGYVYDPEEEEIVVECTVSALDVRAVEMHLAVELAKEVPGISTDVKISDYDFVVTYLGPVREKA